METPDTWMQLLWLVLVAGGTFLATKFWDWWKKDTTDRREFEQERHKEQTGYEREQQKVLQQVLSDNAVALKEVSGAITSVMEHLDGMANRDVAIQNFLMVFREHSNAGFDRLGQAIHQVQKRQEQIGSELLAYAMGRDPNRKTDYTVLQRTVDEQAAELDQLRKRAAELDKTLGKQAAAEPRRESERGKPTRILEATRRQQPG